LPQLKCCIIGDGPEKDRLLKLSRELEIAGNVEFAGFLEYDALIARIKSSRVFVLPSSREGFGIIVIEAFACGVPVISTSSPMNAAKHFITNKNGLVVENYPSSLAKGIMQLLNYDEASRKIISQEVVETSRYFDWGSIVTSLQNKYETFL
ncbi:glycosyltransferase, partial [Methanohalophilus sp. DAL1]|uniref:glycosyltransferase n=1 Tax=Methanohalophilus sp. DAL1 TaxID=1864608 RepID=UPI0025BC8850